MSKGHTGMSVGHAGILQECPTVCQRVMNIVGNQPDVIEVADLGDSGNQCKGKREVLLHKVYAPKVGTFR